MIERDDTRIARAQTLSSLEAQPLTRERFTMNTLKIPGVLTGKRQPAQNDLVLSDGTICPTPTAIRARAAVRTLERLISALESEQERRSKPDIVDTFFSSLVASIAGPGVAVGHLVPGPGLGLCILASGAYGLITRHDSAHMRAVKERRSMYVERKADLERKRLGRWWSSR